MKSAVIYIVLFLITGMTQTMFAQMPQRDSTKKVVINGEVVLERIADGDTLLIDELEGITISIPRTFENNDELRRYQRYRQYANKVYPYAVESIKIFRQMHSATEEMKNRDRKKYIRKLRRDLKDEFKDPLKNLSRTQGKILVKMIERELDTPMYFLLKELQGGFSASKWQTVGKLYGYDLKEGYVPDIDKIMDAVLQDFDISYDIK